MAAANRSGRIRRASQVCEFEATSRARGLETQAMGLISAWPAAGQALREAGLDTSGRLERGLELARAAGQATREDVGRVRVILDEVARIHWSVVLQYSAFAWQRANRIMSRMPVGPDVELSDLHDMVLLAMYEAARRFKPEKGFKFTTYAKWWIKSMAERMSMPLHLPSNMRALRIQAHQHLELMHRRGLTPGLAELAEVTGRTQEHVSTAISYELPRSISEVSQEDGTALEDSMPAPEVSEWDGGFERALLVSRMRRLTSREQYVIRLYYGIGTDELSCVEIAREMGVSRETIRAIRNGALEKLKEATCGYGRPVVLGAGK